MIFRNAVKTPDGTVIESKYRHDYVAHKDKNGETYIVDGGKDYLRRSFHPVNPPEDLTVLSIEGDHKFNRQHFSWGTYGKSGEEKFRRVILKDMSTAHILAILETQGHTSEDAINMFKEELKYRDENK